MAARLVIVCLPFLLCLLVGCGRRQEEAQEVKEFTSTELTLPQIPKLPLTYKPTNKDIQTALRNAGFYQGEIDGDIGPMSKQAIREFQAENNLQADGRVGPKTWAILEKYLSQGGE
ncbi:peptidoglycan-binding protein [Candidatus Omnitrophota bacterium]